MEHEFSRTELMIGSEKMNILKSSTVIVLGVGGVGSHCIEALARGGVGKLILVDHDKVSVTNINRQSIAFHNTVGQYKTQVMRQMIAQICPDTTVITHECFVTPDNLDSLFAEPVDYIVDAIDNVTAKLALAAYAFSHQIPIISCMGTGNKLHPELFEITDITKTSVCPLCKVMRKELKTRGVSHLKVLYSKETPLSTGNRTPGSISFVPPVAGLMIAGNVIRELLEIE